MQHFYRCDIPYEIAIDECGRGPLFGRLYAAAVILPKDGFAFENMKDSKKIKSKKRMTELASYIKEHAIAYSIQYIESDIIDKMNILQANMQAMHACVREVIDQLKEKVHYTEADYVNTHILVDGNYFKPYSVFQESSDTLYNIPHTTMEQGDNKYHNIAAASIIAKHARDSYIEELCKQYPLLKEHYSIHTNMGYGTKLHMEGIQKYGITNLHRRSFRPCGSYHEVLNLESGNITLIQNTKKYSEYFS